MNKYDALSSDPGKVDTVLAEFERDITIGLYKTSQGWVSRSQRNQDAFGVMDIATAFTANADADYVLQRIQALNPECNVILIHG